MDHEDSGLLESYHSRVLEFKRSVEHALPYGEPLSVALIAFMVTTLLLLFVLNVIGFVVPSALPYWAQATPYAVGMFAGYTGWKYTRL
jgi:hypothetical protein